MRTTLCLMLLMLSMTIAAAADNRTSALEYESKLDKSITISLRAATLKEVLSAVEKATGVHLLVDREIAQDKATVCVKDQPARDVLRALAQCFDLGWSTSPSGADKPYLRLWADRDYLAHMADRDYQDYLSIVGQYDKELKATAAFFGTEGGFQPPPELMAKLQKEDVPEYHRLERRGNASRSPTTGASVLQFLALSEKQREQLQSGEHVVVSGAEIAAEALKLWPEAKSFDFTTDRTVSGYMLRCAPRPLKVGGSILLSSAYFDDSPYTKEADKAAKRILADPEMDKALPEGAKIATDAPIKPGDGSAAVPATMSDGLLELAKIANIPVVAQYVSEYRAASPPDWTKLNVALPPSAAKKISERAAELGKEHTFAVGRDGQFLLGKCLLWHRLRLREVPEATLRAWQKECCGLPFPTFNGFVAMAQMRWEQVRGTIENERKYLGMESLIHLARSEYPLKIYGTLTDDQRKWLQSGKELPATALTSDQQSYFMSGFEVREKPTYEGAKDQNWPSTASLSLQESGYYGLTVYARAEMRPLGELQSDFSALKVPENTPQEDRSKVARKLAEDQLAATQTKLRAQIAKERPEVAAKDIGTYTLRYYYFTLKLGEAKRECEMVCSVPVQ